MRVERPPRPTLARHVARLSATRSASAGPLLPDAAVELVWSGTGLFVRGSDTRPYAVGSFPERTFVVLTFRPGAAAGVLGLWGRDLADSRVPMSELWGHGELERLESLLAASATPEQAARVLEDAVEARIDALPDPVVEAIVAALRSPRARVAILADRFGYSERQLLRRCVERLGAEDTRPHPSLPTLPPARGCADGAGARRARRRGRVRRPGAPDARGAAARRCNAADARVRNVQDRLMAAT